MGVVVTEGCRVCGDREATPWGEENGFSAVRCANCDLVYLWPWPSLSDRDRSLQYGAHEGDKTIDTNAKPGGKGLVREYRKTLVDLYGESLPGRHVDWLDIGCGYGEFLRALRGIVHADSTLVGSEPNERKAEYARSNGLDVSYKVLGDLSTPFTHISLLNVFSHLPEPVEFLGQAKDLLVPGGELLIQTGNGGDIDRRDLPGELWFPDHLVFAGMRTLHLLMNTLGMEVEKVVTYKFPRLTPVNVAKDLVKRMIRPEYNPVRWSGPSRTVWLRARKV
ncbi:class I SAM-dependent methyltransferase [Mycolicibacterium elephantis]